MNILQYTNGIGHLVMSVLCVVASVIIIILAPNYAEFAVALLSMVASAWFIPGAAKQVAQKVQNKVDFAVGNTQQLEIQKES